MALALSVGADAIDAGRVDVALEALAWAKHLAPRVASIREAHGVARYLDEDFAGALTELQAYRRMTGRTDQNHLIADCLRGLGRDLDRVTEPVEVLLEDSDAPADRQDEGVIVWASALADDGQVEAARALIRRRLQRASGRDDAAMSPGRLRLLVVAADLAARAGDETAARAYRDRIAAADPELHEEAAWDDQAMDEATAPDVNTAEDPRVAIEEPASEAAGKGPQADDGAAPAGRGPEPDVGDAAGQGPEPHAVDEADPSEDEADGSGRHTGEGHAADAPDVESSPGASGSEPEPGVASERGAQPSLWDDAGS